MAQIRKGTTYATNDQVTATNLNAHVDNAILLPGAVSEQTALSSVLSTDSTLVQRGTGLYKATLSAISDFFGSLFVRKSGDTMTGSLVLNADPSAALGATTKQYTDSLAATKVSKSGDTMTGPLILSGNPTDPLGAATRQYVQDLIAASAGAKMFVLFDGTVSPPVIRKSFNVSNITKNGTGDYTINFTTPMADTNYVLAGNNDLGGSPTSSWTWVKTRSTSSVRIVTGFENDASDSTSFWDSSYVNCVIFN